MISLDRALLHRIFRISILMKGIDGILETVGGLLLLFINKHSIAAAVRTLFSHELAQDPSDIVARFLIRLTENMSLNTRLFGALYLLIHGVIKIFLVGSLWRRKLWAYPLAGVILVVFVIYQIFRIVHSYSVMLLILTVIDIVIIVLLRFEYRRLVAESRAKQ